MNLDKAYDKICRKELWSVLYDCVEDYLVRNMNSLYDGRRSCAKFERGVGSCIFNLRRRLKQGYAMSPWLFDIFFYTMVRQENEGIMGRGVRLEEVSNSIKYYMQRMQY